MVGLDEIVNFIVPVFLLPDDFLDFRRDILQTVFFTTISVLFIITLYSVLRNANEKSWNKIWYKKDETKKFDAEYITVDEVSVAAETKSEKLANAMPSILLTVGLLGTFVGLGIALDNASSILADTNAIDSTEKQMTELMAMLDGLGAKFKTSTWGLSAFILLKFILSFIGYESKRLEWSANKVKEELESVQESKKEEENLRRSDFSSHLDDLASTMTNTLISSQTERFEKSLMLANDKSESLLNFFDNSFENLSKVFCSGFSEVNNSVNKLIEQASVHQQESQDLQKEAISQNKDVRDAMVSFIEKNERVVDALSSAATNMSKAATDMGQSASQLEGVISNLRTDMEGVIGLLKNDLSTSIAHMNTSFSANMGDMTSGLQSTIADMNESFKNNISEMSGNLNIATGDISNAVKSLSSSVEHTMTEVTITIKESMDLQAQSQERSSKLQQTAQQVFTQSTGHLNEYIIKMTGLVEKLSGDIMGGLNAVSTSNRNMVGLAKKVEGLFDKLSDISALNETLVDLDKTLQLDRGVDFTPVLACKDQHHNELLLKIDSLSESAIRAKNISEEILKALQYTSNDEHALVSQEA